MNTQLVHTSLSEAAPAAIELSKEKGYAVIILSKGKYYVEDEPGMIRTFEEIVGEYENGELIEK